MQTKKSNQMRVTIIFTGTDYQIARVATKDKDGNAVYAFAMTEIFALPDYLKWGLKHGRIGCQVIIRPARHIEYKGLTPKQGKEKAISDARTIANNWIPFWFGEECRNAVFQSICKVFQMAYKLNK